MDRTTWESIKGDAQTLLAKLKALIHEGNVRRIVVKHEGRTVAEFPLTAGVVGTVIAPALAAIAAIVALLKDCTVEIEKADKDAGSDQPRTAAS
jgi:hypothetical protein